MKHLSEEGIFSAAFRKLGAQTFEEACHLVNQMPYQRNRIKSDALRVLNEGCGTCSSKHEVIKRLAEELQLEACRLILCMFRTDWLNKGTP